MGNGKADVITVAYEPSMSDEILTDRIKPKDKRFDVHQCADTAPLNAAVEMLAGEIEALEGRARKRTQAEAVRFRVAIRVLLLNLFAAWSLDPLTKLGISLDANAYSGTSRYRNPHLTYRQFEAAFRGLEALGFLKITNPGYQFKAIGEGQVTRVVATDKLASLFSEQVKFSPMDELPSPTRETILLRDSSGRLMEYDDTEDAIRMRNNLARINYVLRRNWPDIEISREEWVHLQERLKAKEDRVPIDLGNRYLYRVFNDGSFQMGGRFYGGWWQNVPSDIRPYIRINGKLTVEIDYSSLHPRMLFAMEGLEAPDDLYDVGLDPTFRDAVKQTFNAMINAPSNRINPVSSFDADATGMSWPEFRETVRQGFGPIAKYFGTGEGIRLQRLDSDILEKVMLHFAEHDIPCLPIHDSVIMHHGYAEELEDVMGRAFEDMTGILGRVKGKLTSVRTREARGISDGTWDIEDVLRPDPMFQDYDERLEQWFRSRSGQE
jgi:hypothetical protein